MPETNAGKAWKISNRPRADVSRNGFTLQGEA